MEIVSNKLSLAASGTPPGSARSLDGSTGSFSHPRRWNASINTPPGSARSLDGSTGSFSHPRRWNASVNTPPRSNSRHHESVAGSSLMSLKAYYRKLRTFKGTIKALISFRRLPTFAARSLPPPLPEQAEESDIEPHAIAKLTDDDAALQTMQSQVKGLVEKGHVVTESPTPGKTNVAYRMQGNLEHYTEANLRKRLKLQEHPHMVALTQRLWLSAVRDHEDCLGFREYEAYMLRLHRLILPEFDLTQSKALIQDDWTRDTDGGDALDYRFFHFSMFELVDLWTDTVESEDYISLLYCIMHSLTFEWNRRHVLKDLDDINPIDILEASKDVTMDEIERDLAREVNSDDAQLYRDRVAPKDDAIHEHEDESEGGLQDAPASGEMDNDAITSKEMSDADATNRSKGSALDYSKGSALDHSKADHSKAGKRDPHRNSRSSNPRADATSPRASSATRHASSRKISSKDETQESHAQRLSSGSGDQAGDRVDPANGSSDTTALSMAGPTDSIFDSDVDRDGNGDLNLRGLGGSRVGARQSVSATGPRIILSGNQYAGGTTSDSGTISIMSLGSGGECLNMVLKASYNRKPSVLSAGSSSRHLSTGGYPSSSGDHAIFGHGLNSGQGAPLAPVGTGTASHHGSLASEPTIEAAPQGFNVPIVGGQGYATGQSTSTRMNSPRSPLSNGKQSETRQGSLLVDGGGVVGGSPPSIGLSGSRSPRARSAKSNARSPSSTSQHPLELYGISNNERPSVTGTATLFSPAALETTKATAQDPRDLVVGGGLQSSRMSIHGRPSTTSTRTTFLGPASGLDGFLQTRAYQETSTSPTRPGARKSTYEYDERPSIKSGDDLSVLSLGVHQLHGGSPRLSSPTRPPSVHYSTAQQKSFVGAIVGSNTLAVDVAPKASTPRASMAKINQLPSSPRIELADRSVDLGLSGASARLSVHRETLGSPRAIAATKTLSKKGAGIR